MKSTGADDFSIRLTLQIIVITTIDALAAISGVFMTLTPSAKLGVRAAGLLFLGVGGWLAVRASQSGATVSNGQLEVRGFVRTRRYPLTEIKAAYQGKGRNNPQPTRTFHIVLATGEDRIFQVISTSGLWRRSTKVEDFVDRLNGVLSSRAG